VWCRAKIGNAVINDWTDSKGMYDFFWTHALISDATADAIGRYCNFSAAAADSDECDEATSDAGEALEDIDIYNSTRPTASPPTSCRRRSPPRCVLRQPAVDLIANITS